LAEKKVYVLFLAVFFLLFSHGDIMPREQEQNLQLKTSTNGISLIKEHEGFSRVPYECPAAVIAIGYGSTTYENGKPVLLSDPPITEAAADRLFRKKIYKYEKWVNKLVKTDINQNQFDALVSPNDPQIAIEFLKWRKANGKVTKGLETRRQKEVELYFKSIY
jgi:lysozyme